MRRLVIAVLGLVVTAALASCSSDDPTTTEPTAPVAGTSEAPASTTAPEEPASSAPASSAPASSGPASSEATASSGPGGSSDGDIPNGFVEATVELAFDGEAVDLTGTVFACNQLQGGLNVITATEDTETAVVINADGAGNLGVFLINNPDHSVITGEGIKITQDGDTWTFEGSAMDMSNVGSNVEVKLTATCAG